MCVWYISEMESWGNYQGKPSQTNTVFLYLEILRKWNVRAELRPQGQLRFWPWPGWGSRALLVPAWAGRWWRGVILRKLQLKGRVRQELLRTASRLRQQPGYSGQLSRWGWVRQELRQKPREMIQDADRKTGRIKLLHNGCVPLGITLNFTEPHL